MTFDLNFLSGLTVTSTLKYVVAQKLSRNFDLRTLSVAKIKERPWWM